MKKIEGFSLGAVRDTKRYSPEQLGQGILGDDILLGSLKGDSVHMGHEVAARTRSVMISEVGLEESS